MNTGGRTAASRKKVSQSHVTCGGLHWATACYSVTKTAAASLHSSVHRFSVLHFLKFLYTSSRDKGAAIDTCKHRGAFLAMASVDEQAQTLSAIVSATLKLPFGQPLIPSDTLHASVICW